MSSFLSLVFSHFVRFSRTFNSLLRAEVNPGHNGDIKTGQSRGRQRREQALWPRGLSAGYADVTSTPDLLDFGAKGGGTY